MPVESFRFAVRSPRPIAIPRLTALGLALGLSAVAPLHAQELDSPPPVVPAQSAGCGGPGQLGQGFVAYTGLGGRLAGLAAPSAPPAQMMMPAMMMPTTTAATTATADFGAGPQWNLLLGYKLCRVVIGLNLDLLVYSPTGSSNTSTSFSLSPEVQVALARSSDLRAELLGVLNVGLGQTLGFFHLGGFIAPGVRYWLHRHIALSSQLGLSAGVTLQGKAGQTVLLNLQGTAGILGGF